MTKSAILFLATGFLAYSNGANDNFKGVATLYGSGTASYRCALALATLATLLGSLASLLLAPALLAVFSGKGLVPDALLQAPSFSLAVGLGAAVTVLLATWLGFPVSTTHALTGALVGAGALAGPVHLEHLFSAFLLPLLLSPFMATGLSTGLYSLLRALRRGFGVEEDTCVCVGQPHLVPVMERRGTGAPQHSLSLVPTLEIAPVSTCRVRYGNAVLGLEAPALANATHYLSASLVCFARSLNDTPKIAALLLMGAGASVSSPGAAIAGIAACMAAGGLLSARRVARRMAKDITALNAGQGLAANLVASALVLGTSPLGMPVSTTHVSCGALFGIGLATGEGRWRTIAAILMAWVTTLPVAAALAALIYSLNSIN